METQKVGVNEHPSSKLWILLYNLHAKTSSSVLDRTAALVKGPSGLKVEEYGDPVSLAMRRHQVNGGSGKISKGFSICLPLGLPYGTE